ncbi:hypothetical protein ACXYMO_07935 [Arenibacterium sp. CAU 1754]
MTTRRRLNFFALLSVWLLLSACPPIEEVEDCFGECCVAGLCQTGMTCGTGGICESFAGSCQCSAYGTAVDDWGTATTMSAMQSSVTTGAGIGSISIPIDRFFTVALPKTAASCGADSTLARLPVKGKITVDYKRDRSGRIAFRIIGSDLVSEGADLPCLGATGPLSIELDAFDGRANPKRMMVDGKARGKVMAKQLGQTYPFSFDFEAQLNPATGRPQAFYSNLKSTMQ